MWAELSALLLGGGLAAYVGRPLFAWARERNEQSPPAAASDERKLQVYEALRDLEYDWRMHKISAGDYRKLKRSLTREALEVLSERERRGAGV